jgi:hypothetical protein
VLIIICILVATQVVLFDDWPSDKIRDNCSWKLLHTVRGPVCDLEHFE